VQACDLALVEGVLGELLRESNEDGLSLLGAAVAQLPDGEHEAGEGGKIVALLGGEFEETDSLGLVRAGTSHTKDPADGRSFETEHVVLDADGEVGIVKGGVDGKGLLGVFAAELAELEGAVLLAVNERCPVGLHARGDGLAVEGIGIVGVMLQGNVGEVFGLGDAVLEALLERGIDVGTLAGGKTVIVGEELDVEDAQEVELGKDVGCRIGGGTEAIVGMGCDPLLKVSVSCGEVQVVHGVVAVVEGGASERSAKG